MGNSCACHEAFEDGTEMLTEEDRKNIQHCEKVYDNGARYIGQMDIKKNVRHGQGKFIYENESAVYEGQWGLDKGQGKGRFQDGVSEYLGQWNEGHKHGYGEERWFADNTVYRGLFRNGKKHGQGKYSWGDGSSYEGQFLEDEISGKGCFRDGEGEYTGQFVDSSNHGQGIYKASDGSIYDGQWDSGEKHGQGTLIWPDGRRYIGQWYADSQHGTGEFIKKEGSSQKVYFVNGRKCSAEQMESQIGKDWTMGEGAKGRAPKETREEKEDSVSYKKQTAIRENKTERNVTMGGTMSTSPHMFRKK